MVPTSHTEIHPADDYEQHDPPLGHQDINQRSTMSHITTQKEHESNPNSEFIQRAKSHHPSKNDESEQRPTRPTRGTTRDQTRTQTSKTAMTRQRTGISRQQTGLSKAQSRQNEERSRQQAPNLQEAEVDPDYYELNPWYGQRNDEPVFGLNKPLPHTVRGGMRRRQQAKDEHEEDEIEAAQAYHDPGREPDLERGEADHTSQKADDDERRNKRRRDTLKEAHTSRSRSVDYFDQTPDRSRSAQEVDVPVMPPGEEMIEKYEAPTSFQGQTGLWQSHKSGTRRGHTQLSCSSQARSAAGPPPQTQNNDRQGSSRGETLRGSRDSPREKNDSWETEDFDFDPEENQEFMDPYELQLEYNQHRNRVAKIRALFPQALAEFWGTAIAVCIGLCVNLSVKVSQNQNSKYGGYENQCWGWGLAFMIGIYLSAGISGGHLNPVISLVFCIFRGFPVRKLWYYIVSQVVGSIAGACMAYGAFRDAINVADPAKNANITGAAFYPGPNSAIEPMSVSTAFCSEFLATAILILTVLALGDDQNAPPGAGLGPLIIGLVVVALMMAFGYNTGPALSPARDLGPRTIAWAFGWKDAFGNHFAGYGPWGACIAGGIVGALLYDVCIFQGTESPVNMTFKQNWHGIKRRCAQMRWSLGRLGLFCLVCCGRRKTELAEQDEGKVGGFARWCSSTKLAVTDEAEAVAALAKGDRREFKRKTKRNGVRIIYGGHTTQQLDGRQWL